MAILKSDKLISLMSSWPDGAVLTSEWLAANGYSKSLLQQYRRSGWVVQVGKGAYQRGKFEGKGLPQQNVMSLNWQGGVYALQALSLDGKIHVHVAARSALELSGYAHFLGLSGKERVWLFIEPKYHVPAWLKNYQWHGSPELKIYSSSLFPVLDLGTLSDKNWGSFNTKISCPERAMMELLELCPQHESLEHAKLVMENLATLRPKIVSRLLKSCDSIKVKRLFLALADLCNHDWLKEIDTGSIDLGVGPRILEPGHGFHAKFEISIPKKGAM